MIRPRLLRAIRSTLNLATGPPGGETVAINIATGLPVWRYPMGGHLALSAQGVLYITTDSTITAIRFTS